MTTFTEADVRPTTDAPVLTMLAAVGVVMALNGGVLGTRLMFDSRDYSEVAGTMLHLVHYVTWTACLIALSQLVPRLRGISDGVLALAGIGLALDACARFVSAFVSPYLSATEPHLMDGTPDAILLVPLLASSVICMVGMAALGITSWRRHIVPPPVAALLVVGGLAVPVMGPISTVLLGAGLVWFGSAARRPV